MKSDTRTRMHGISNLLHHSTLWLSCVSNENKSEWGAPWYTWRIFIFIFIYLYMDKWKFHNSFQFVELQQFIFHTFLFDCIAEKWRLQFAQRTLHKRRAKREPIPKMKSRCVNRKQREKIGCVRACIELRRIHVDMQWSSFFIVFQSFHTEIDIIVNMHTHADMPARAPTHAHIKCGCQWCCSCYSRAIFMCYFLTLNYRARQFYECGMCAWESVCLA